MTSGRRVVGAVVALLALAGCNPAQRARQAKQEVDSGNSAACTEERAAIEKAVQAYMLLNPDASVTEAGLVTAGFIHSQSTLMDVTATGAVIPAPGSPC